MKDKNCNNKGCVEGLKMVVACSTHMMASSAETTPLSSQWARKNRHQCHFRTPELKDDKPCFVGEPHLLFETNFLFGVFPPTKPKTNYNFLWWCDCLDLLTVSYSIINPHDQSPVKPPIREPFKLQTAILRDYSLKLSLKNSSWNLKITHFERENIFQTWMLGFYVRFRAPSMK